MYESKRKGVLYQNLVNQNKNVLEAENDKVKELTTTYLIHLYFIKYMALLFTDHIHFLADTPRYWEEFICKVSTKFLCTVVSEVIRWRWKSKMAAGGHISRRNLSDHDIVSGTLKIFIPPIKKPRRKVYLYQKCDYESMRHDTLESAKEKYFNGHSDTRSIQDDFDLLTSVFKTRRINISHRKLAGRSFQFPGLHLR